MPVAYSAQRISYSDCDVCTSLFGACLAARSNPVDRRDPGSWQTDGDLGVASHGSEPDGALLKLSSGAQPSRVVEPGTRSPLADAAGRPHRGDGAVVHLVKAADCGVCQPAVVGIVAVDACPGGRAVPGDRSSDQRDTVRACLKSRATRYAPCRQQPHRDAVAHPVSGPARASFCSRATATTCLTLFVS
jgi:hypothetical protein